MDGIPGYYYYYFPIKSFLVPKPNPETVVVEKPAPVPMLPQHVHVTMVHEKSKAVEPLFMAISSFVGVALMVFLSVMFVPKIHKLR